MRTIILILTLFPQLAFAQGGSGVKGGDAVACFDRPVKWTEISGLPPYEDLVVAQTLTETGRKHIRSASPREAYQIDHLGERSGFWNELQHLYYDDALEAMIARFDAFPFLSLRLREIDALLRPYWKGMPSPSGLYDVADSGAAFPLIKECDFVQAVERDRDFFTYDSTVNELFEHLKPGPNAALMQLHEVMYFYAVHVLGHRSSEGVERVLIEAIGKNHDPGSLKRVLDEWRFTVKYPAAFLPKPELAARVEAATAGAIEHFERLGTWVASGVALCPENERRTDVRGRRTPLRHPQPYAHIDADWTAGFSIWTHGSEYASPVPREIQRASAELRAAVSDANQKSWFEYEILDRGRQNCRYTGKPVTEDQLNRILRAKEALLALFR